MPNNRESFRLSANQIVDKIKELIKEGNVRRIMIQNEREETILEIPMTVAVIGTMIAPILAAVGALAALMTNCTIIVERKES